MDRRNVDILEKLNKLFPDAKPELNFTTPFELLIATILSAQCTDIRVNIITEVLFDNADTPEKILELGQKEIQNIIKSCGIYRLKSKYIFNASRDIINK
ncbi:MAG: endonuclease III, partial [Clostridiales bacterium]|nr:endonuclease III [Clostridiales bacterium]